MNMFHVEHILSPKALIPYSPIPLVP